MSIAEVDKTGYEKLVAYDQARNGAFAHVVSEYCGLRLNSDDATSSEKLKTIVTFNVPAEKRLEWVGFLMYAMRTDVITDAKTRTFVTELFDDIHRVANGAKKVSEEQLGLIRDQRAQVRAELETTNQKLKAAKRSPFGVLALAGGGAALGAGVAKGAALGGVAGGPVGALVGGGIGGIIGAFAFLS
jgi:hypothetical protein